MADPTTALARSPIRPAPPVGVLAGWEVSLRRSPAALTLADCTPTAKVLIHAAANGPAAAVLDVGFGEARRRRGSLVARCWPAQWLLVGAAGSAPALIEEWRTALAGDAFVSIVDVTSGRALLRLTGQTAADLLAKICALDLGRAPSGSAFRTSVAKTPAEVVRHDRSGQPSFLLGCDRSCGQYLFDAVLDAGAEFSIDTTGFDWEDES